MSEAIDLESMREIFSDKRVHIALAMLVKLELAKDRSHLKCLVSVFPEQRQMIARMTWENVGPESGDFEFPAPNDLLMIAFPEGDHNQCYVIRRLTSLDDKIPLQAVDGDRAIVARAGKKIWASSDTRVNVSRSAEEPTENMVLGQVAKELFSSWLQLDADHRHMCMPPGYLSLKPDKESEFLAKKASPVDDQAVLSDLAFTEK